MNKSLMTGCALAAATLIAEPASAREVQVTIENLAPADGNFLTPAWVGFHDGTFDVYDLGAPASAALERLAEDGNTEPLSDGFHGTALGAVPVGYAR